jgi:CubicO group peptidase (beta-lactamase class C family)
VYARNLEVPAAGGVGTARALARVYGAFATGGRDLGLCQHTLQALMAPAVPPKRGFFDECLQLEWKLSLGFAKPSGHGLEFGSPSAFGMPGWGGTLAYADPEVSVGYAYVTSRQRQGSDLSPAPHPRAQRSERPDGLPHTAYLTYSPPDAHHSPSAATSDLSSTAPALPFTRRSKSGRWNRVY